MRNLKLVSNKALTLTDVFMIVNILGTSMEVYNLSVLGSHVGFIGHNITANHVCTRSQTIQGNISRN